MVSRWKKLAYSLVSVMVGAATFSGLSLLLPGKLEDPIATFSVVTFLVFAVSLAGWLIALPLILIIDNIAGWRFWLYLGIGSGIGPIVVYQWLILPFLRSYKGQYSQTPAAIGILGTSFLISCLAALSYLFQLRWAQVRSMRRSREVAAP